MRVMFRRQQRERKLDVFFSPKAQDVRWEVTTAPPGEHLGLFWREKNHQVFSPAAADET